MVMVMVMVMIIVMVMVMVIASNGMVNIIALMNIVMIL